MAKRDKEDQQNRQIVLENLQTYVQELRDQTADWHKFYEQLNDQHVFGK
jgi:hypothetical protein